VSVVPDDEQAVPRGAGAVRRGALALGSNLGDRAASLTAAVGDLAAVAGLSVVAASSVYETGAVGGPEQGAYLNAVLVVETALDAHDVLAAALEVEALHGRVRLERWGPRTLDVDVLALGAEVSDDPVVLLPHPRAHERGFVLVPWAEVDPTFAVPGRGRVLDLLEALSPDAVAEVRPYPLVLSVAAGRPA
jgi:2-amino-4-hydroxy-6-hydroxymethyldihydropteridine diphosphokinase